MKKQPKKKQPKKRTASRAATSATTKVVEIKTRKQMIEERLAALYRRNGESITPEAVIDDARDPSSPLHACFEWDDKKAAHQHRLDQARELIRAVPVHVQYEEITIRAPKYVRDSEKGSEAGYVELTKLRSSKEAARETLRSEADRANAALQRARAVATVLGLNDLLEELIGRVEDLARRAG